MLIKSIGTGLEQIVTKEQWEQMKAMRISGKFTIINHSEEIEIRTAKVKMPNVQGLEKAQEEQRLYRRLKTKADCIAYLKKAEVYDGVKAASRNTRS